MPAGRRKQAPGKRKQAQENMADTRAKWAAGPPICVCRSTGCGAPGAGCSKVGWGMQGRPPAAGRCSSIR